MYGDYPEVMINTIRNLSSIQGYSFSRLPTFTITEKRTIRGAYDFISLNHYTSSLITDTSYQVNEANFFNDALVEQTKDPSWGSSAADWLYVSKH